jgi:hypothetical protein
MMLIPLQDETLPTTLSLIYILTDFEPLGSFHIQLRTLKARAGWNEAVSGTGAAL